MTETMTRAEDGLGAAAGSAFGPGPVFDGVATKMIVGGVEVVIVAPTADDLNFVLGRKFPGATFDKYKFGAATIHVSRIQPNSQDSHVHHPS